MQLSSSETASEAVYASFAAVARRMSAWGTGGRDGLRESSAGRTDGLAGRAGGCSSSLSADSGGGVNKQASQVPPPPSLN